MSNSFAFAVPTASGNGPGEDDPLQHLTQMTCQPFQEPVGQSVPSYPLPPNYVAHYGAMLGLAASFNGNYSMGLSNGQLGTASADSQGAHNKKSTGRQTYNADQKRTLEDEFHHNKYVSKQQRSDLVAKTGLSDKQIKIWFQNRRMKKKKQEQGLGCCEMTQESSPSCTPVTAGGGGSRDKSTMAAFVASTAKSEPENVGIGTSQLDQQQEIKSEQPIPEAAAQNMGAVPYYGNGCSLSQQYSVTGWPLPGFVQQQLSASSSATSWNPAYYNNLYQHTGAAAGPWLYGPYSSCTGQSQSRN